MDVIGCGVALGALKQQWECAVQLLQKMRWDEGAQIWESQTNLGSGWTGRRWGEIPSFLMLLAKTGWKPRLSCIPHAVRGWQGGWWGLLDIGLSNQNTLPMHPLWRFIPLWRTSNFSYSYQFIVHALFCDFQKLQLEQQAEKGPWSLNHSRLLSSFPGFFVLQQMSHAKLGGLPDPDLTSFTLVLHEKMVSRPWNFPLSILKLIQEQGDWEWVNIRRIDSSWRLIMDIYVVIMWSIVWWV